MSVDLIGQHGRVHFISRLAVHARFGGARRVGAGGHAPSIGRRSRVPVRSVPVIS